MLTMELDKVWTALLGCLLIVGASGVSSGTAPDQRVPSVGEAIIQLPVEVLGPKGYISEVVFETERGSEADSLYLQIHSPGYKYGAGDKASVQVNGGAWTDISNKTVWCYYPESHYECIGGAFATVRFTITTDDVVDGRNVIRFRFNGTDGLTSGYRVIDLNLVGGDGERLLPRSMFAYEDVTQWKPPLHEADDIEAGRRLWHEARLVDSPLTKDTYLKATCADCHTTSGMDLKYFNYSNHAIVERSVFHSLTVDEGLQIASYIRSLDIEAPGTPWDPPFQPGPGLDERPSIEWAAGAGLEWVLQSDDEMLTYLFPEGVTADAVSADSTLNMREIPIAIQLPDWNEWLPRVHPVDAWGDEFINTETNRHFENEVLALADPDSDHRNALKVLERWNRYFRTDRSNLLNDAYFGGYDSDGIVADYTLGLHQWQAVKTFEVEVQGRLQEDAPVYFGSNGEFRSWIGNSRTLFDVGPHISGPVQVSPYPHGSPLQNIYMTTAWYELQLIVNAGNRHGVSIRPMDWKYHYGHITDLSKWSGIDEPLRYLKAYVKNMQEATNDRCGPGSSCGFYLRHLTPARLVVSASETKDGGGGVRRRRDQRGGRASGRGQDKNIFDSMDPDTHRQVIEAVLRSHVRELISYRPEEWERGNGREALAPVDYVPTHAGSGRTFDLTSYADHYYRSLPLFKKIGVSESLLDTLSTWGADMWPKADWSHK